MMKIIFLSICTFIFSTNLLANSYIISTKLPGNVANIDPKSKAWLSASFTNIVLYSQAKKTEENVAKKVRVKSIYDGKNISFLLEWRDDYKNIEDVSIENSKSDSFSFEFPIKYKNINTLPYVNMGDTKRSIILYSSKLIDKYPDINNSINLFDLFTDIQKGKLDFNKSVEQKSTIVKARGLRDFKELKNDSSNSKMHMLYKSGKWLGTLSMKLKSKILDLSNSPFFIAFKIFDAKTKQINVISSWTAVKLSYNNRNKDVLNEFKKDAMGSVINGKKEVQKNCAICHRYGNTKLAPDFIAPNLTNIGGYSTKEYLMESIVSPSAIILTQNKNSTYSGFDWYQLDENNNKISTMPSFAWMNESTRNDIVAYLKTLKVDK